MDWWWRVGGFVASVIAFTGVLALLFAAWNEPKARRPGVIEVLLFCLLPIINGAAIGFSATLFCRLLNLLFAGW